MIDFFARIRPVAICLTAVFLLCAAERPAMGGTPTKMDDIRSLLEMTYAWNTVDSMAGVMAMTIPPELKPPDDGQPDFDHRLGLAMARIMWRSIGPELMNRLATTYDSVYSHEDIKAMIAFYSSPAGRRVTRAAPEMARQLQESIGLLAVKWAGGYKDEEGWQRLRSQLAEELKKQGTP